MDGKFVPGPERKFTLVVVTPGAPSAGLSAMSGTSARATTFLFTTGPAHAGVFLTAGGTVPNCQCMAAVQTSGLGSVAPRVSRCLTVRDSHFASSVSPRANGSIPILGSSVVPEYHYADCASAEFQLVLWSAPSRLSSPLASLCLRPQDTRWRSSQTAEAPSQGVKHASGARHRMAVVHPAGRLICLRERSVSWRPSSSLERP